MALQEERESLRSEISQGQTAARGLLQDLQDQQAAAGKQMESMAENAEQSLRGLSQEHERALAQMSMEHQSALDNANRALVSSEVSFADSNLVARRFKSCMTTVIGGSL